MSRIRNIKIARLREQVGRIAAGNPIAEPAAVPQAGLAAFQEGAPFLKDGLPTATLHEIEGAAWDAETGAAATGFAASVLPRSPSGLILWAVRQETPFPPRLASFGLDADRVIFCRCPNDKETLAALEEALAARGIAAAIGEVCGATLTQSRRLHLICERSGATGLLLRRQFNGTGARRKAQGSAATTRWRVRFAPTEPQTPGLGPPRWQVDLLYRRGGMPASFLVEWNDETGDLYLVAKLADNEAVPHGAGLRRTG
jgi:protein ImuA